MVIERSEAHEFLVSRTAFVDPSVLDAERREIFDRCWLYLAHISEIPQANDFLTRSVGGRELLLARDRKKVIHAFFNTCPHRGAMVEREKSGNKLGFQCFYHGWAFNNNGGFATRYRRGDYPEGFNADGCKNLTAVPRLEEYRGLLFVNFDASAPPLVEYLGPAAAYINLVLDHSAEGMEICGGTHEYSIKANWKLLVENSIDGYHALATHSTYFDYLTEHLGPETMVAERSPHVGRHHDGPFDLGNGHAVVSSGPSPWGRPVAHWIPAWGDVGKAEVERRRAQLHERFGPERGDLIASWNRNMIIFPNLVINDIMAVTLRTFYPLAPDLMNVSAWALAPTDETPEFRGYRLENFLEFLGPGGFATPDDQEALESCQRGYRNAINAGWNDISKGMSRRHFHGDDEEQMRCFWREWAKRLGEGTRE
jgi:p-cumate 2,3-dioxygenase alpha subunit